MDETLSNITGHSAKTNVTRQIREQQTSGDATILEKSDGDDLGQPRLKTSHPNLLTSVVVSFT